MKHWRVDPKKHALVLEPSGSFMAAACHHYKGRGRRFVCCGGCYARAGEALNAIEKHPGRAAEIVAAVHAAMIAEGVG